MGIIKRQAAKSSITSFVGIGVSIISAVFIIPMVPVEIYGMVSILLGIASLILPLTLLGLNTTYIRFNETYPANLRELIFSRFYKLHTAFSLSISVIFYLISGWFLSKYYYSSDIVQNKGLVIAILIFLMGQFTILCAYATSKYRLNVIRIAELLFQKLGLTMLFLAFVLFNMTVQQLILGLMLLYLMRTLTLYYYKWTVKQADSDITEYNGRILNKSTIPYSIFALVAVIMHQAIIDIDTLMVGSMVSVAQAGVYKYAFYIAMVVDLPRVNLVALLFPLVTKFQSKNNFLEINKVYKRSSNLLLILGSLVFLLIIPNLSDFFKYIPNGETYAQAKYVVIFISLSKLFNMAMGINFEIIASSSRYYVMLIINVIALIVVVVANNILIPIYGANGAALSTLIVWIIWNTAAFFYLRITHNLSPFSTNTLKIALLTIFVFSMANVLPLHFSNTLINIAIRSLTVYLFIHYAYKYNLSTDFNELVDKLLVRFRLKSRK